MKDVQQRESSVLILILLSGPLPYSFQFKKRKEKTQGEKNDLCQSFSLITVG